MATDFTKLINDAQMEIDKVVNYVNENKNMFSRMNLKMYDASYYGYAESKKYPLLDTSDEFYRWCDDTYISFAEDFKMAYGYNMESIFHHIGRTSTFYLLFDYEYAVSNYGYGIINELLSVKGIDDNYSWVEFSNNDKIIIDFDCINESWDKEDAYSRLEDELNWIIDGCIYNNLINLVNDGIQDFYDKLTDLKKNQVEYFKEHLEYYQSELEYENEQNIIAEQKHYDECMAIKEKYSITDEDWSVIR